MNLSSLRTSLLAVRRPLVAAALLMAIAFGPAANAATIRYQFDDVSGTGPWATYGYSKTIYFYQLNLVGSPYMDLNTATNVATFGNGFLVSSETNNSNHDGPGTGTAAYDPTTFTLSFVGGYVLINMTFSTDLATPGPATLAGMNTVDPYLLRPSTAVTGSLSVLSVTDVPEPASLILLGVGLAGLTAARRRRG